MFYNIQVNIWLVFSTSWYCFYREIFCSSCCMFKVMLFPNLCVIGHIARCKLSWRHNIIFFGLKLKFASKLSSAKAPQFRREKSFRQIRLPKWSYYTTPQWAKYYSYPLPLHNLTELSWLQLTSRQLSTAQAEIASRACSAVTAEWTQLTAEREHLKSEQHSLSWPSAACKALLTLNH